MAADSGQSENHVAPGVYLPDSELDFTFSRSSGPGGQNVNKLNSKAMLRVPFEALEDQLHPAAIRRLARLAGSQATEDALVITSDEHRSQRANRNACLDKLRDLIVRARHRPKRRKPTRPTRASVRRRLNTKRERGEKKRLRKPPKREE